MNEKIDLGMTTYADLFSNGQTKQEEKELKLSKIPLSLIDDFPNHPFKVREDDSMLKMIESVREFGILVPAIMRPKENGRYEMIAGHRRKFASIKTGKTEILTLVRELTNDEATILMVDSNLQRENVFPSEKAYAYKMKLEAMNRQGQRSDLTSTPVESKLRTNEKVGLESGESREQIRRYIRLTELIEPILDMVDEGKIAFRPAVEISYLAENEQKDLLETMESEECTPSLSQAILLKKLSKEEKLNIDIIFSLLSEEKPNQMEKIIFKVDKLREYIPKKIPLEETENYVIKALEHYNRFRERQLEKGR